MNSWNGLDFLIFLIFVVNTMWGMVRGATREIISIMGLSAALIITIKFTVPLANFFNQSPLMLDVVQNKFMNNFTISIGAGPITMSLLRELFFSISLLVCFVGTYSICEGVMAFPGFVEAMSFPYATLNRKVGASLGAMRGYVFTLVLLVILGLHIFKSNNNFLNQSNMVSGSSFARLFRSTTIKFNNLIDEQKPDSYKEIYQDKNLFNEQDVIRNLKTDAPAPAGSPEQTFPAQ